jgi:hypothetical protein
VATRYILAVLAAAFAILASLRLLQAGRNDSAARTWLIIAAIFGLVAAWLFR